MRPFTPPWSLTQAKYAAAPGPTTPNAAAGPVSGTVPPISTDVGVTPGASWLPAVADGIPTASATTRSASALVIPRSASASSGTVSVTLPTVSVEPSGTEEK